jgi:3'(2'), 5'-bisphosphate nucleotidase
MKAADADVSAVRCSLFVLPCIPFPMHDYSKLLEAARTAVVDACTVCREVQANMDAVRAISKDDSSPVTVADFACQAVVARRLQELLEGDLVLIGEETSAFLRNPEHIAHLDATLAAARSVWPEATEQSLIDAIDLGAGDTHHAGYWTLDPIDGTKGFLRRQQYAVSLAYIHHGEVVVGVLGCPNLPLDFAAPVDEPDPRGCIYMAIRNQGVWEMPSVIDEGDTATHPILVRRLDKGDDEPLSLCTSVEESHSDSGQLSQIVERITRAGTGVQDPVRLDSQAKYAIIARGQADAYLRLPTRADYQEWIWDHAAGSLIATEAGCAVTDIDGKLLDFSHGKRLSKNRGILAAPPVVHGKLLGAIRELGV